MANNALAVLESALRERKLDRTLTSALPPLDRGDSAACAATGIGALDACLQGGLPRGQLSEVVGAPTSGRATVLTHLIRAATRRAELAALVDAFDCFDVASAIDAGVDFERLLWIRGHVVTGHRGELAERAIDRGLKALNLVLQAGGFAVVVFDLADVSPAALRRIPSTTWLRVQRTIEGSDTACVLAVPQTLARSAGGLTLAMTSRARWAGTSDRSRHFAGLDVRVRVISPRRRGEATASFATHHS